MPPARVTWLLVTAELEVEIWSDVVCPWCYLATRRFARTLAQFPHRDRVAVRWRSYELDPHAPARIDDLAGYLAAKYDITLEQAQDAYEEVTELAAGEGLEYRFDRAIGANTFDAHRLIHLAAEHGRATEAEERLFAAHFTRGEAIGDRATLVRLAGEIGLDPDEAARALDSDLYADQVRADQAEAAELQIRGVPYFLLDRRFAISGAQPEQVFVDALQQAWDAGHPAATVTTLGAPDAPGCSDDACAI